jgi:HK97 family phage major capsid protein
VKLTRQNMLWAAVALLIALTLMAVCGHPVTSYLPPEALASIGAAGMLPFAGEVTLVEVKDLVEKQGTTWEEYKKTNDERIAKLAKGESVEALEAKLAKMETSLTEAGKELKELTLKSQRPAQSSEKADAAEKELKSFNARLQALSIESGKGFTPVTREQLDGYKAAIAGYIRKGVETMSPDERKAINVGTNPQGGYLVTEEMEGTIDRVLRKYSTIRDLARVIPIGASSYKKLVKTSGTSGSTTGNERTAPTEGTSPGWVELEFVPGTYLSDQRITQESLEDSVIDVEGDLMTEIGIEFAEKEGTDFVSGDGVNRPRGFASYATVANASYAWGKVGYTASGNASSFAASNPSDYLIDLVHSLRRQYRANGAFIMNDATLGAIRKFKDGQGNYLWGMTKESFMAGAVGTLLGYPVATDDFMPDVGANAYPIAFADWSRFYYVIDRKGMTILRDPFTAVPYVKFVARRRVGGGIANFEAGKLLKIATA